MNAVIYIVSVSLVACCICQEIIDRSFFSKGDRQSCCKNEHWERGIVSKIEKLEHAILDLHEPLGNTTPDLQEQLRNSTADIQALKESNSNLQEQLRNSSADMQALKASNSNIQGQLRISSADIQALEEKLRISTSDIQTLNQSNLDLQEQLRQAPLAHCVAGSYSNTGLVPCTLCEVGTYQTSAGSTLCKPCEVGSYQASVGSTSCTPCEVGSFQPSHGSSSCTTCGAGKWTPTTGSTANTDCKEMGTDCEDTSGAWSGVYKIKPQGVEEPFSVYCDKQTRGEKWTVFQRRQDGSVDFKRDWASYETGFGDLMGEFWLGNRFLHSILNQGSYQLEVRMSDFEGNSSYAHYNVFSVGSASSNYSLAVSDYSGNAGDSLADHNNMQFTTYDRDNDMHSYYNCAALYRAAWWHNDCGDSMLNGEYRHRGTHDNANEGLLWRHWKGNFYSLKSTTMRVRRRN